MKHHCGKRRIYPPEDIASSENIGITTFNFSNSFLYDQEGNLHFFEKVVLKWHENYEVVDRQSLSLLNYDHKLDIYRGSLLALQHVQFQISLTYTPLSDWFEEKSEPF